MDLGASFMESESKSIFARSLRSSVLYSPASSALPSQFIEISAFCASCVIFIKTATILSPPGETYALAITPSILSAPAISTLSYPGLMKKE